MLADVKTRRARNLAHTIPMVNKAMEMVRALADGGDTTVKALAFRLELPHSSAYRILRSLEAQDWVRSLSGGRHELSLGLLPLLASLRDIEALAEAVEPALRMLASHTALTAKASIRRDDFAVTIARCESPQATSIGVRIGARFHLALGSSGAVLLSALPPEEARDILDRAPAECWEHQNREAVRRRLRELKAKGWCADLGTFRQSCHAVSAPLQDAGGKVLAALTVIGFPNDVPDARLPELGQALQAAARQAETALRARKSLKK